MIETIGDLIKALSAFNPKEQISVRYEGTYGPVIEVGIEDIPGSTVTPGSRKVIVATW